MVMSWIWTGLLLVSLVFAWLQETGGALAASVLEGTQAGIMLAVSMAGSICLWTGAGHLMEHIGLTDGLAKLLRPLLRRIFPTTARDPALERDLSTNICANFLGLGNAATPMGISASRRMAQGCVATDELCRLIVLNTASIQLIPANVAAVRVSLGGDNPFDILPAVWCTSLASVAIGLGAAWVLGKVWNHD